MTQQQVIKLLGYDVFSGRKEYFKNRLKGVINTISPHSYIMASHDILFRQALMTSDVLIPDGVGIVIAARVLARKKIEKITGSDLHSMMIDAVSVSKGSCFYLGSSDETLSKLRERLAREHPAVRVGSFSPPYKTIFSDYDNFLMINAINMFKPDVLFVGMTAPKQEKWVYENKSKLSADIICSIGAVFDFYAGTIKRAPKWMQKIGLEWLHRSILSPSRLGKRNLCSNPLFIRDVLLYKLRIKK